jgi:hypothetical protein
MSATKRVCKSCINKTQLAERAEEGASTVSRDFAQMNLEEFDTGCEEHRQLGSSKSSKKKKKKKKKNSNNPSSTPGAQNSSSKTQHLVIEQFSPTAFFSIGSNLERWWHAYQTAFQEEHIWMEARGESTSRGMKLDANRMMPLIFNDELGSKLQRVCFVVSKSGKPTTIQTTIEGVQENTRQVDECACGYATIDEDPTPGGVCHLRMVLVEPENQRQGVGMALLEYIISHERFAKRHIGLKFAVCHDYEHFYGKAGFVRLGADSLYVYMALRR